MDRRPISSQIRTWLSTELNVWRAGGILADDQPGRILDLYETPTEIAGRKRSLAMFVLCSVAAFLIGLAVFLVVSYNWSDMSAAQKLAVIFGSLLGLHGAGLALRFRSKQCLTSEIVLFAACILYGSAIWLIAQIFHIQSHYPDGIWYWAVGVLIFAMCLDTILLHALYVGLLALWVGTEILGFGGSRPWLFHGFWFTQAAWTLPLLALPGLWWAYRRQSPLTVGLYAPLLAWWAILQPVAWQWQINPIYFVGLAGALLLLIAEMHREGSRMAKPFRLYGVAIAGGVLVPMSFADFIIDLLHHSPAANCYVAGLAIGVIGAVAALIVVVLQQRETSSGERATSTAAVVRRQWLPIGLVLLLMGLCLWNGLFTDYDARHSLSGHYDYSARVMEKWSLQVLIPTAAVNVTMIALAFWLMRLGLREYRTGPFAAGVLYFLLWAVLRYGDLFAGVGGMLGAAVMFLLCGVGLLAVARFWLHRKPSLPSPFGRGAGGEGGGNGGQWSVASDQKPQREEDIRLPIPNPQSLIPHQKDALTLTLSQVERGLETGDALTMTRTQGERGLAKTLLLAGVALQLIVLVGMIVFKASPLWTGETVLLRVVPVDPRDMFRGDYVALAYDFSRIPPQGIPELGKRQYDRQREWDGTTVYVSLVPEEDGKHYRMGRIGLKKPTEGRFIRGTIAGYERIECGIESYYVEEGTGREYEDAARSHRLSAEVSIAPDGRASLRKLHIESPLPSAGPAYDFQPKFRWPSNTTYRVRHLPHAKIQLDGRLNEPEWSRANVERHFVFPWKKADAPPTEFMAFCDDDYLYFAFRAEDPDLVALDKLRAKEDAVFEDRVEMFLSRDQQMKDYFALEIDSRGRVHECQNSYYRQSNTKWHCDGLETAAHVKQVGNLSYYVVEGRIPLLTLVDMGFPRLTPGTRIPCGLYRAEFSHDRSGKPVVQKKTIHNRGRKFPDGPPPLEEWISWIDPKTPEPDFHVPSSLGWLEVVE